MQLYKGGIVKKIQNKCLIKICPISPVGRQDKLKPGVMWVLSIFLLLLISGCDKAPVKGSADGESASSADRMVILNNLGETLSAVYSDGAVFNDIQLTGQSPNDIVVESPYLYIVNSLSNSVLVLNEENLSVIREISVGSGKNPMSACVISKGVVAVSCFRSGTIEIVDVAQGKVIRSIDLNTINLPSDTAGIAGKIYPTGVAYSSGKIFICLSNLTDEYGGLSAAGPGVVAVIDSESFSVKSTIILKGADPVFARAAGSKVIVACAGHYSGDIRSGVGGFKGDGTIEVIDASTATLNYSLEVNAAPFSFTVSEVGILLASNAMGGTIPRVDLSSREVDYISTDASYISSVCVSGSRIYALDFNHDRLMVLDESGDLKASYTVGDGPLAILQTLKAGVEEAGISQKMEILPDVSSIDSEVIFDASSSSTPDGAVFTWELGDGTVEPGKVVKHRYAVAGSFKVKLTISSGKNSRIIEGNVDILNKSPFAASVIEYNPAPGQFISNPRFNNGLRAVGAPKGGGGFQPDNSSQVSLGGFGGSITLAFDHEIKDCPGKTDFIVFGNSQYNRAPLRFIEPGIVEISADGKKWYVIPGPLLKAFPLEKSCMTYPEKAGEFCSYELPSAITDSIFDGKYLIWGYADLSPVIPLPDGISPWLFYTKADDPLTAGIDKGTCGGDAFDIAWAIDPATGEPSGLAGFKYIKITTAVSAGLGGSLGECSTEIDAVAEINNNYPED